MIPMIIDSKYIVKLVKNIVASIAMGFMGNVYVNCGVDGVVLEWINEIWKINYYHQGKSSKITVTDHPNIYFILRNLALDKTQYIIYDDTVYYVPKWSIDKRQIQSQLEVEV